LLGLFAAIAQDGGDAETSTTLPSGRRLALAGKWTRRETLWPDAAIVLRDDGLVVLESGASEPRFVHRNPWGGRGGNTLGLAFSRDGGSCFAWLDHQTQLVAVDVKTGALDSLLMLPTHVWNYEGLKHLDPSPVLDARFVVEHDGRLLVLVQEETNDEVASGQRSADRRGGHRLLSIPTRGRSEPDLARALQWPGEVHCWDFARSREELYLLLDEERSGTSRLRVRKLDGTFVDRFGQQVQLFRCGLSLSPDEHWLLVEHGSRGTSQPFVGPPVRRLGAAGIASPLMAERPSILVIDLESGDAIEVTDGGREATWTPDSKAITYLREWELWRLDLATRARERLAWREPSAPGAKPMYFEPATWSGDGSRLFVDLGGNAGSDDDEDDIFTLVLDFRRCEFLVLPGELRGAIWSPVPHPFRKE
jgi:hypothetical protein